MGSSRVKSSQPGFRRCFYSGLTKSVASYRAPETCLNSGRGFWVGVVVGFGIGFVAFECEFPEIEFTDTIER